MRKEVGAGGRFDIFLDSAVYSTVQYTVQYRDVRMGGRGGSRPPILSNLQESWPKKSAMLQESWPQYFP